MSQTTTDRVRWTTTDIDLLASSDYKRYEIIDGELFVTRALHWTHQETCGNICVELERWSKVKGLGQANIHPGIIFTDSDSVIPDVVWITNERLAVLLNKDGHLTGAPELVAEVLSPGAEQERREREAKLKLYSLRGVQEYWIADWRLETVEIYRRENAALVLVATLTREDELNSPLLPDFACFVGRFFE